MGWSKGSAKRAMAAPIGGKVPQIEGKNAPSFWAPNPHFGAKNLESGAKLSFFPGLLQNATFEG